MAAPQCAVQRAACGVRCEVPSATCEVTEGI